MKKFWEYIKLMITAHSGISSKRVCGVLGFLTIIVVIIFCSTQVVQAPEILETFIWAVCMLLGLDSITDIWKKDNNDKTNKN